MLTEITHDVPYQAYLGFRLILAGLELDPSNAQLKDGLQSVKRAQSGGSSGGGLGGLFGPEFMARLAMNPQVSLSSMCSIIFPP